MSSPDVRVRLSPEGVAEVLAALRRVQAEGKKSNRESATGLSLVSQAAGKLKGLLPTLGFAGVVAGLTAITRQAFMSAAEMGDLAQVTGSTVENLSVFRFHAERNNATLGQQTSILKTLATNMEGLRRGNEAVTTAFAQLNLSAEDFVGLDTVQAAFRVAEAIATIEDPARRAAAAKALLGKSGAELLPTLRDLAGKGFAAARAEAERLGVVMDSQLVANAQATNNALFDMRKQVSGLALSFVGELAPHVTQAMTQVSDDTAGKGLGAMRIFGAGVGLIIAAVVNLFRLMADVVAGTAEIVGTSIGATLAAANQALRLNFSEAATIVKEGFADIDRINREASKKISEDLVKLLADLTTPPPPAEIPAPTGGGGDDDPAVVLAKSITKARLEEAKARAAQELSLQTEALRAQSEAEARAFEQGLTSLERYTEQRRAILERQAAIEIATLELQRAALAASVDNVSIGPEADAERLRIRTELGSLDTEIRVRQLALARELAALEGERAQQELQLAGEMRKTAVELDELEGRRHAAFQRNLEEEIRQLRILGTRAGQSAAEIDAIVERFASARTGRLNFDEVTRQGTQALTAFQRDAEQIQLDQEAGIITQFEGELRLIDLQRQRLAVLRELAAAGLEAAEATADPELIARAQAFSQSVAQIGASYEQATNAARQLKGAALEATESGIADLLSNIQDVESLEDAFRSLASTVAATMQRIAAEILARQAIFALLRAFGGGSGAIGQAVAAGWHGGRIRGYAAGGDIRGPRLPIAGPDKIPLLAEEGEFMLRRARVSEPGALDFLRAWNAGHFTFRQAMAMPRFQAGGLIGAQEVSGAGAAGGDRGRSTRIINVLDPRLAIDAMNTASGEEVILNVIDRNAEKLRQRLQG